LLSQDSSAGSALLSPPLTSCLAISNCCQKTLVVSNSLTRMFTDCSVWASARPGAHRARMARVMNRTAFILTLLTFIEITVMAPDYGRRIFHFPHYICHLSSPELSLRR